MSNRDTDADYKAALIEEHAAYVRAGRGDDADQVAEVLAEQHGYTVAARKRQAAKKASAPERADQKALEEAVPPKPARSED